MPWNSVLLKPGVNQDLTPTLNEAGISQSQLVRFHNGLVQKNGGWTLFYPVQLSGRPWDLHAWEDLAATTHLAVGTTEQLDVITNGNLEDITPQTTLANIAVDISTVETSPTVTIVDTGREPTVYDIIYFNTQISIGGLILSGAYQIVTVHGPDSYDITAASAATATITDGGSLPSFATTEGSAAVVVTFDGHGLSVGESAYFIAPTSVGGLTIQGAYLVQSVTDENTFTINSENLAGSTTSATMNSGDLQLLYYIIEGPNIPGTGYGVGAYGSGGYGTGISPISGGGTEITSTDWSLDNFGEDLIACPPGGPIYLWSPEGGFGNAGPILGAPFANNGIFVMMPEEQILAWGSSTGGVIDPLLLRWCDAADYTDWVATSTNQAGSYRLPTGSKIMGGLQASQQALLWTDIDLWSVQYIGYPLVYGFNKLASGCGLIARHAVAQMGASVYWMSQKQFFSYGSSIAYGTSLGYSGVVPIECPVWDVIFQNIDLANIAQVRCGVNSQFNEVTWFYPSAGGSGENDSYVRVSNPGSQTQAWDYGLLARSTWIDQSVLGSPIATDPTGYIYQHEVTNDANGLPMLPSFTSGYWEIAEGEDLSFVDYIVPDMKWGFYGTPGSASVKILFNVVKFPGDTPTQYGPYTMTSTSTFIPVRFRGRQVAMQISSSDLGSFWRLGRIRYRFAPDGRQ